MSEARKGGADRPTINEITMLTTYVAIPGLFSLGANFCCSARPNVLFR
jgi:hypothetical protein